MFPFRRIAFPVDFSGRCGAAVPYVADMVRHFRADLLLVHAFEHPLWVEQGLPLSVVPEQSELERLREFAEEKFRDIRPHILVVEGEPGKAISCGIQRAGADLVMVPTHGRGTFRRFLIGSVTTKLIHDLSCPIWTSAHLLPEDHPDQRSARYRSIICAVDTDVTGLPLVKEAGAFAKSYGAKVSLIHVVSAPAMAMEVDFAPFLAQLVDAADQTLRQIREESGVDADIAIVEGPVADRIRMEATRRNADLVIVGRGHSKSGIARFGSALYRIVRESPCPVLSF